LSSLSNSVSDWELLERFIATRDESAFGGLMKRHGPMIMRLCRRILGETHAAEDAFQATFLVLARRAKAVQAEALARWLYSVGRRVSLKMAAQRRRRELAPLGNLEAVDPQPDPLQLVTVRDLLEIVEHEVARMPRPYQMPVVLCLLEGQTLEEAARRLGWTVGSVRGRLERGRNRLRTRLASRGLTLAAALTGAEMAKAGTTVSRVLIASTARSAASYATGMGPTAAGHAIVLADSILRWTVTAKLKLIGSLVAASLILGGSALLGYQALVKPQKPSEASQEKKDDKQSAQGKKESPPQDAQGDPLPANAVARLGNLQFRQGQVSAIHFTPDGKHLIALGHQELVVWDQPTGRRVASLPNADAGRSFSFCELSPDGKLIATADLQRVEKRVQLWDRATLKLVREFGETMSLNLRFSPNGELLAVVAYNSKGKFYALELWEVASGKLLKTLPMNQASPGDVLFLNEGKTVVAANRVAHFWDVETGKKIREIDVNENSNTVGVACMAVSPDSQTLAVVDSVLDNQMTYANNVIRTWDLASAKERPAITIKPKDPANPFRSGLSGIAFSSNGKSLIAAGADDAIHFLDPTSGKEQKRFASEAGGISGVKLAPDGKTLAVAFWDHRIRLIDVATGKELKTLLGHSDLLLAAQYLPGDRNIVTAGGGRDVIVWDAATGKELRKLRHERSVCTLAVSGDRSTLAVREGDYENTHLRVWNPSTGKERALIRFPAVPSFPHELPPALSFDGKTLAMATRDDKILLFDVLTGETIRETSSRGVPIGGMSFLPDGKQLLVWHQNQAFALIDVATGNEIATCAFREDGSNKQPPYEYPCAPAAVSADGQLIAWGGPNGYFVVRHLQTGQVICRLEKQPDDALTLALSPDGSTVAWSGKKDLAIHLIDIADGKERLRLTGHAKRIRTLAFSANGQRLVSGSEDTTALVWDVSAIKKVSLQLSDVDVAAAWTDLVSEDAKRAYVAGRRMSGSPKNVIPFLAKQIRPIPEADAKQVERLIKDLDSDDFAIREKAAGDLAKHGEQAASFFRKALSDDPSAEVRRRLESILKMLDDEAAKPPVGERLKQLRILELLNRIGKPEAVELLRTVAKGAPDAWLTVQAKNALDRVERREGP
jgi:RNA polymerase sigma factor (sigma-70 family)